MPEPINIDEHGYITVKINIWRVIKVFIILALAVGAGFLPIAQLDTAARICLMIFVGAAGFWVTEAIPPFATAIMVIVLQIFLLGQPGGPLDLEHTGITSSYQIFLNPLASPVLVLFFGGFIMALAASKHGLDVRLAKAFLKPFGTRPALVLLGIIATTALFSMFISNTATTAMMFAIFMPLISRFEGRGGFKKALILSIPFAANVGGMGTIIGTPPNAVAASILQGMGYPVSFLSWMVFAVPLVLVLLLMLWFLLLIVFKPREDKFEILFPEHIALTWDLVVVSGTFTITILLWISEPLHKIPAAVVALVPIMVFTMFQIIDRDDLKKIEWDVLVLLAGGLALGIAMQESGLSNLAGNWVKTLPIPPSALLVVVIFVTIVMSNFMSHTAASNLLIPILVAIPFGVPQIGAISVALASSLAMSLPISTPPNAIAFASRSINTSDMIKTGTLVSLIGAGFVYALMLLLLKFPQIFG